MRKHQEVSSRNPNAPRPRGASRRARLTPPRSVGALGLAALLLAACNGALAPGAQDNKPSDYDACASKACGDACSECDPKDASCSETAVAKYCDASDHCGAGEPTCREASCSEAECGAKLRCPAIDCSDGSKGGCTGVCLRDDQGQCGWERRECPEPPPPPPYEPCAGKACGDTCSPCDPKDPSCAQADYAAFCDSAGECRAATPVCGGQECRESDCGPHPGMECSPYPCGDGTFSECLCKAGPGGDCSWQRRECSDPPPPPPPYEPCAGLSCGELCSPCDPKDPTCAETDGLAFCNAAGECRAEYPVCGGRECRESDCGPHPGMECSPYPCEDGTFSECLCQAGPGSDCSWQRRECGVTEPGGPCAGKECGDACSRGGFSGTCDMKGRCGAAYPECDAPGCPSWACGPQPDCPAYTCADGSIAGCTGNCVPNGHGCAWEVRECDDASGGGSSPSHP